MKKRNSAPDVQFNDKALAENALVPRAHALTPSLVAKRDLRRYYRLLDNALARLTITRADAEAISAACRNWDIGEIANAALLYAQVERTGTAPKGLVDKLRAASLLECVALIDAAERFNAQDTEPVSAFFKAE